MTSITLPGADLSVLVISDTHVGAGRRRRLPAALLEAASQADAVLHAGDLTGHEVLDVLGSCAPTHAVLGNNDYELKEHLPECLHVEVAGTSITMVHDSGPTSGREARLKRWFPDAGLVVFGHSHLPWNAPGLDGQWLLNPGSPTERRRAPSHTMAWVRVVDGVLQRPELVDLEA